VAAIDSDNVKIYEFHLNSNRYFMQSGCSQSFSIAVLLHAFNSRNRVSFSNEFLYWQRGLSTASMEEVRA